MSRTLTVKTGGTGGNDWGTGWHQLTISKAKYGDWQGNKFLELAFKDYPDNFTLRLYAKVGSNGEEFVIGNIFRFANAGIEEVLDDGSEDSTVIKINDDPHNLFGKELNVLFYKKGEYTEAYSSVAPTVFKNAAESFSEDDVEYWKGRAEKRFAEYNPQGYSPNGTAPVRSDDTLATVDSDLPF